MVKYKALKGAKVERNQQARIGSVGKSSTTTVDTDRDTANQVCETNNNTRPKQGESSVHVAGRVQVFGLDAVKLGSEDDGHDHTVNGDDLAENNRNQVLRSDSRSLNTSTQDRRAG